MTMNSHVKYSSDWWKAKGHIVWKYGLMIILPPLLDYLRSVYVANIGKSRTLATTDFLPSEFLQFESFVWMAAFYLVEFIIYRTKKTWGEFKADLTKRFEEFSASVNSKSIVFNVDLSKSYSKDHINDLSQRLEQAFPRIDWNGQECPCQSTCEERPDGKWITRIAATEHVGNLASLYAVDATSPHRWWSESMLGYLAVQAEWKAQDSPPFHQRQLSRLFVWTPADLRSPLGIKLILLHRLFGFHTYVMLKTHFEAVRKTLWTDTQFDNLRSKEGMSEHFGLKEFVIWEGYSGAVDNKSRGYRSYWNLLEADHPERETHPDRDGETAANQAIKWRDFPNGEADCYLNLFKMLTKNVREVATIDDFVNRKDDWSAKTADQIYKLNTIDGEQIQQVLARISKS